MIIIILGVTLLITNVVIANVVDQIDRAYYISEEGKSERRPVNQLRGEIQKRKFLLIKRLRHFNMFVLIIMLVQLCVKFI